MSVSMSGAYSRARKEFWIGICLVVGGIAIGFFTRNVRGSEFGNAYTWPSAVIWVSGFGLFLHAILAGRGSTVGSTSIQKFNYAMRAAWSTLVVVAMWVIAFRVPCRGDCLSYPIGEISLLVGLPLLAGLVVRTAVSMVRSERAARIWVIAITSLVAVGLLLKQFWS